MMNPFSALRGAAHQHKNGGSLGNKSTGRSGWLASNEYYSTEQAAMA